MIAIHHATVKRAARMGVRFEEAPNGKLRLVRIADDAFSDEFDSAGEAMEAMDRKEVEFEALKPNRNVCGVMAKTYHDRYSANPHGPGCGDGLDIAIRTAIMVPVADGKTLVADPERLKLIGVACDLWRYEWESLNIGMRRMNLANRIRAYLRNNAEGVVEIGGVVGRFGVGANPPKAKKAKAAKAA